MIVKIESVMKEIVNIVKLDAGELKTNDIRGKNNLLLRGQSCLRNFLTSHDKNSKLDMFESFELLSDHLAIEHVESFEYQLVALRKLIEDVKNNENEVDSKSKDVATKESLVRHCERKEKQLENIDVLIVCALSSPELEMVLRQFLAGTCVNHNSYIGSSREKRTYYSGDLLSKKGAVIKAVALSQSRMGMVDTAALVTGSIITFNPKIIAMTGVCAGRLDANVEKLDLIAASSVLTHDTGKYTENGFEPEPYVSKASELAIQRIEAVGATLIKSIITEMDKTPCPIKIVTPKIHTGIMACGSSVINRGGMLNDIAKTNRKVVGLDMESYAMLRAAELIDNDIIRIVVKGVMDHSQGKADDVKESAASWSASFLTRFLESEIEALIGHE